MGCNYSVAMIAAKPLASALEYAMLISILYAVVCLILDLAAIRSRRDAHQLELLLLRHEVRVAS